MEERGGGIRTISLLEKSTEIKNYFQVRVIFDIADSMGANFINSCLEKMASELERLIAGYKDFDIQERNADIIMAILSNYNPECSVEAFLECDFDALDHPAVSLTGEEFGRRFALAVQIAQMDIHRAVTHNKGIFNGIDGVIMATGNDFRAVEAGGHAWAARSGKYSSLSEVDLSEHTFRLSLSLPLALGTVGGLTNLHPMAKLSLAILDNPSAKELMQIVASAGLANHFSAIRSLITTGIQKGHMKMHLSNILHGLNVTDAEHILVLEHFKGKTVSYSEAREFIEILRQQK